MDRSCLRQQIERGQTPRPHSDRDRRVNIRSQLPPLPVYSSASEDLAKQLVTLSLDRTEPPSNVVPIDEFTSRDFFYDLDSYHRVHEQLLKDREYVKSWHTAICCNPHLFKDKVSTGYFFFVKIQFHRDTVDTVSILQIVLDVRCGLGLLSMFAAIAGAKHVYAIDKSNIIQLTRRVVHDNRFANKITIVQGSAADINLPVDSVDIIISTPFV